MNRRTHWDWRKGVLWWRLIGEFVPLDSRRSRSLRFHVKMSALVWLYPSKPSNRFPCACVCNHHIFETQAFYTYAWWLARHWSMDVLKTNDFHTAELQKSLVLYIYKLLILYFKNIKVILWEKGFFDVPKWSLLLNGPKHLPAAVAPI